MTNEQAIKRLNQMKKRGEAWLENAKKIDQAINLLPTMNDIEALSHAIAAMTPPTDEAVREAIEKCKRVLSMGEKLARMSGKAFSNYQFWEKHFQTFLAALRQMRPEPCDRCQNVDLITGSYYTSNPEICVEEKATFCPNCGKEILHRE